MTDSPTPCTHDFPPILAAAGGGADGWTATCRSAGCGFRCGSADPNSAVPSHWKRFIPMLAAAAPADTEPERDDVLLLLRAVARLASGGDGDAGEPLRAYEGGSRSDAVGLAEKLRDRFCDLAVNTARQLGRPAFVAMNANVIASDMLTMAMVPAQSDPAYTVAVQALRSLLAKQVVTLSVSFVERRLLAVLGEVGW